MNSFHQSYQEFNLNSYLHDSDFSVVTEDVAFDHR